LQYITAVSAFICSKMRPDGFGGMAMLITADTVMGKSTNDIVEDFLNEALPNWTGASVLAATPAASHQHLRIES
jgi:hypothetical protein